jgi:hypothetical protein
MCGFAEVKSDGYDPNKIIHGGRLESPEPRHPERASRVGDLQKSNIAQPPGVKAGEPLSPSFRGTGVLVVANIVACGK